MAIYTARVTSTYALDDGDIVILEFLDNTGKQVLHSIEVFIDTDMTNAQARALVEARLTQEITKLNRTPRYPVGSTVQLDI